MGRTVLSYRQALNREIASWAEYRRGLSPEDQACFDEVANIARQHADASSLAARPVVAEDVFMSAVVSLLRKIRDLQARIDSLEKKNARGGGNGS